VTNFLSGQYVGKGLNGVLTMKAPISPERAEILALEALAWLAARPDDIGRFLTTSGLGEEELRRAAGDRELLGSLLGFLLQNEALLLEFCQDASIEPKSIHTALHRIES
jgi:hypothetical protein